MTSLRRIGSSSRRRIGLRRATTTLLLAAVAVLPPASGRAGSVTIFGSLDANFFDDTGSGAYTLNTAGPSGNLDIRDFLGSAPNFDHRSVVAFDLFKVPSNAVIQNVTFNFEEDVATGNTGRTVGLLGYSHAGSLTVADATASATLLSTYDNFALGVGLHSVDLTSAGVTLLDSLVSQGKPLDLRIEGTMYGTNTAIVSIEAANSFPQFDTAPSITVTFLSPTPAPAPSGLVLAGIGGLLVLGWTWYSRKRTALLSF